MASMQCHKPANYETCPQNCHNKPANESSLGQKVSEMASFLKGGHHGQNTSSHSTQCYSQTVTYKMSDQGLATSTNNGDGHHGLAQHHATNDMACHGKTKKRGEHKSKRTGGRNLLQKIKDGISGHSSGSDSSDSDSEDEGSCREKN